MIDHSQCFQLEDGLTRLICNECAKSFLVSDVGEVFKCPYCHIISGKPTETFVPFNEYLRDSREWY